METVVGDLFDPESLQRGIAGASACIHLAGVSSWDEIASDEVEAIEDGTRAVLRAAGERDGIRLVHVSSAAAVNASKEPITWDESAPFELEGTGLRYAISKHQVEGMVRDAVEDGLDAVIVNPAEVYGPDDEDWITAGTVRLAQELAALALKGGASVVHVDDVAMGFSPRSTGAKRGSATSSAGRT